MLIKPKYKNLIIYFASQKTRTVFNMYIIRKLNK